MTCNRYDDCWFIKTFEKAKPLFKKGYEQSSWIYYNCCISDNQDGCTLSKLSDIEFKIIERELKGGLEK